MRRKIKLACILVILLITANLQAQNQKGGLISGVVQDEMGMTLPGATLLLDKYNRYTISDINGYYEFLNVPEGDYVMTVSYIGFAPFSAPIKVQAGKNTVVSVKMETNSVQGQEVVVMGEMLIGQAKALNKQKTNSNISNVVSSDQAGRFPDANIGDALKRIPGITMQNDQGEARNIIIRGLAPHLNSVTLNGNRVPSAEGDNRNVQVDLIPSDMIANIEVSKTLTSDMDADAIGGSVDLVTRSAPNKQRISATISGGYVPIREKAMYSGKFVYGNRFFDNKFGITLSGSLQNKDYGSDNIEAVWKKDNHGKIYASEIQIRKYDVERIRKSISSSLDYKINDNNTLAADLMYNWRTDRENRYRVVYRNITTQYDSDGNFKGYLGDVRRETKGGIDNSKNKNRRLEDQRVQSYTLRGQHLILEKLDLDWNLTYSKASEHRPNERYIQFEQKKLNMTEDLSNTNYPLIGVEGEKTDKMSFKGLTENDNYTDEKEYSGKINARIPFTVIDEMKGRLRFGLRSRIKEKERDNIFYSFKPVSPIGSLDEVPNTFFDGNGFSAGSKYVPGTFATASYLGGLDLNNPAVFNKSLQPLEFLAKNYNAKEQIMAAYIRWDQNITKELLLIVGLRGENTHINYTGNKMIEIDGDVASEPIKKTNSYFNLFPSISMKYDVKENFILRGAFTTAIARPNYYSLVPYINISKDAAAVSVGNPDLKATYAYNFDLMAEYYLQSVGIVSAGVFYKNLNNFIYEYKNINYTQADFSKDFPDVQNPVGANEVWQYSENRNGQDVKVYGFEVAFQRTLDFIPNAFLKNFTVYANYTYTNSKTKGIWDADGNERKNISLPGTSPHMLNGSLAWENKKFSARASFNYTSDYIDALGADAFTDTYYDKQLFVDMNASYKFNKNFRIFAEANNLTNQPLKYYQGDKSRLMQAEYYKPTFNLGFKCDF